MRRSWECDRNVSSCKTVKREHQVNEHVALECKKMVPISLDGNLRIQSDSGPLTDPT